MHIYGQNTSIKADAADPSMWSPWSWRADEYRHNFQFQKDIRTFIFFPIAVSFIDDFQMAPDGGTCAINNKKEEEEAVARVSNLI